MLAGLLLGFVAASVLVTLMDWRAGVALAILIGMIQDPIRKLTPGTPAAFVLLSLCLWALVWLGAVGQESAWSRFRRADPKRARVIVFFVICLVPGMLVTFSYGLRAWPVAALGALAYISPLLTMFAGFVFAKKQRAVETLLARYGIVASVLLVGVLLEYANLTPGWAAIGTDSLGAGDAWIRYAMGGAFKLVSGFFRSPDIASWHAAALVMTGLSLALFQRHAHAKWWLALVAWGGVCLMVAGRRKGIVMPFVWMAVMGMSFIRTQRLALAVRLGLVTLVAAGAFYWAGGEFGITDIYYDYAQTTVSDAPQRLLDGTWSGVWETFDQSGLLGSGIGTATQGSQHLGVHVADTWQESGTSKLAVELGLPGLVAAVALAYSIARSAVVAVKRASPRGGISLQLGLLAFSAANVVCFVISHQIYGDPTILNLTSFILGMALSSPDWSDARSTEPAVRRQEPTWVRSDLAGRPVQ